MRSTWRVVVGILGAFGGVWLVLFVLAEDQKRAAKVAPVVTKAAPSATPLKYSLDAVAAHQTSEDCWIIVRGQVYDVTNYIDQHPAARRTITDYCGKESSVAFETKERGREHSEGAWKLLENYRVGELEAANPY